MTSPAPRRQGYTTDWMPIRSDVIPALPQGIQFQPSQAVLELTLSVLRELHPEIPEGTRVLTRSEAAQRAASREGTSNP